MLEYTNPIKENGKAGGTGVRTEKNGVVWMLMRLTRLHFQYMRTQLEALDLYPGQPQLLLALKERDNASQRELAQAMDVSPATLTVMLRRMDGKHLIERKNDPQDMRITRLRLTTRGREKITQIERVLDESGEQLEALFTREEKELARSMLSRLEQRLLLRHNGEK